MRAIVRITVTSVAGCIMFDKTYKATEENDALIKAINDGLEICDGDTVKVEVLKWLN